MQSNMQKAYYQGAAILKWFWVLLLARREINFAFWPFAVVVGFVVLWVIQVCCGNWTPHHPRVVFFHIIFVESLCISRAFLFSVDYMRECGYIPTASNETMFRSIANFHPDLPSALWLSHGAGVDPDAELFKWLPRTDCLRGGCDPKRVHAYTVTTEMSRMFVTIAAGIVLPCSVASLIHNGLLVIWTEGVHKQGSFK